MERKVLGATGGVVVTGAMVTAALALFGWEVSPEVASAIAVLVTALGAAALGYFVPSPTSVVSDGFRTNTVRQLSQVKRQRVADLLSSDRGYAVGSIVVTVLVIIILIIIISRLV